MLCWSESCCAALASGYRQLSVARQRHSRTAASNHVGIAEDPRTDLRKQQWTFLIIHSGQQWFNRWLHAVSGSTALTWHRNKQDVDHYDNKRGGDTLAEAEKRWGKLPPTYRSTSRTDGKSGIRLYRIPEGVQLVSRIEFGELGLGGIEICQYHHDTWCEVSGITGNHKAPNEMLALPPPPGRAIFNHLLAQGVSSLSAT